MYEWYFLFFFLPTVFVTFVSAQYQTLVPSVPLWVRLRSQRPGDGKKCKAVAFVDWMEGAVNTHKHTEDGGSGNTHSSLIYDTTVCCVVERVIFNLGPSGITFYTWVWREIHSWVSLSYPFALPPADLSSHQLFKGRQCFCDKQPQVSFTLHPPPPPRTFRDTQAPLLQAAERLPWQWLSCCRCSVCKVVVVEVVVELEEVVALVNA